METEDYRGDYYEDIIAYVLPKALSNVNPLVTIKPCELFIISPRQLEAELPAFRV